MRERIITGVIGVPLLLICSDVGGWLLALVCAALAVLAAYELGKLLMVRSLAASFPLDALAALLLTLTFGIMLSLAWPFVLALLLIILAYVLWSRFREEPLGHCLTRACAALYVGVGFGALLALRLGFDDWRWILLAFLNVWITDGAAHLVGSRYGRNMLAPRVSPHKTWEGALAGLACAAFVCSIYMGLALQINYFIALPLALLFSIMAQLGDLLESALKRWSGVKDSGRLFPGHGGVLDRFDSLLISAPLILLMLTLI
jgi:phosphatidate cytidylyltransferase